MPLSVLSVNNNTTTIKINWRPIGNYLWKQLKYSIHLITTSVTSNERIRTNKSNSANIRHSWQLIYLLCIMKDLCHVKRLRTLYATTVTRAYCTTAQGDLKDQFRKCWKWDYDWTLQPAHVQQITTLQKITITTPFYPFHVHWWKTFVDWQILFI